VLGVLSGRGLRVSRAAEDQIRATTDKATLDRWLARALTAASIAEVLEKKKAKAAPRKKAARAKR